MTERPIREPEHEERRTGAGPAKSPFASKAATWGAIAAMLAVFWAADFHTGYLWSSPPRSEWIMPILLGLWMAQVDLITVWMSLARGNIVVRISWFILLTMGMWYGLLSGLLAMELWYGFLLGIPVPNNVHHYAMQRADVVLLIAVLLSAVVVLWIPLRIFKKVSRWQLSRTLGDSNVPPEDGRQFHIRDLLFAMFVVALVLSPLRQVLAECPMFNTVILKRDVCLGLPVILLCNLCITMASIRWAFASNRAPLRVAAELLILCAALTAIEFGCYRGILGIPVEASECTAICGLELPRSPIEDVRILCLLNLAQCAAVLGALLVLREIGFRLSRTPAIPPPSPGDSEQAAALL
jgi:hypothetical protein